MSRPAEGRDAVPFEVFDKKSATAVKTPMVTIQKGGMFSLNRAAVEAVGSSEAVELLYDPENRLIGFRPTSSTSPRAFMMRPQGKTSATYMVAGRAFTQHYGIDSSTALRYAATVQDGVLIVDLNSESVDVTGPRTAMKSRLAVQ